MADENLVTVTNNENPPIDLEIVAYKNIVDINFLQSIESVIAAHNTSEEAHANIKAELALKANTTDVNASLATKANISTTYTKAETDTLLANKINTSDTTITKQGNTFNGVNQLLKLDSGGKLPQVDGSALTNLSQSQISGLSTALNGKEPLHSKYDSGWFAVTVGTTYTKTHGLGTSNIRYIVLTSPTADGANANPTPAAHNDSIGGAAWCGFFPKTTSNTTISFLTAAQYIGYDASTAISSGYYRIIAETL